MLIYLVYDFAHLDLDEILKQKGCNIIVTFANLNCSEDVPKGFPRVLIDSGGYQMQTGVAGRRGKRISQYHTDVQVSVKSYADWLDFALPEHPEITGYFNLDVMYDIDTTLANQKYLEDRGHHPIPVWHPGESDWLLEYYCSEYDYVSIGGVAGAAGKKIKLTSKRLRFLMERIITKYSHVRFHALGVGIGATTMFRSVRPYSIDFSTWMNSYRYGHGFEWNDEGLLRECKMPEEDAKRIRTDKIFRQQIISKYIDMIQEFGKRIDVFTDNQQKQFDFTI